MSQSASNTVIALMALMRLRGVGRRAALRVVDRSLEDQSECEARDYVRDCVQRAKLPLDEVMNAWSRGMDDVERSWKAGIRAYAIHDAGYPVRLRNIPDPPAVLFVKGANVGLNAVNSLAVVGTREPTSYGQKVARKLAATAVETGFVIVSGLAHGCDTLGHEGCLDANGVGVAVMAHGLDKVYPAANKGLAQRLLDHDGCLVSEYPLGMTPMRTAFAERDRIQSGLSDGVLVVETDVKGGTMHTVRFSREQNRALACIEHPLQYRHEDKTQGTQKLIKDRWADPIPDGVALAGFLDKLKQRPAITAALQATPSSEPTQDDAQIRMAL